MDGRTDVKFDAVPVSDVRLLDGIFKQRAALNRNYMMSLSNDNLLQNYYLEAGLMSYPKKPENCHWGWESPTCQLRGHFLGHWLSAAAWAYNATGDTELKAKADRIVAELGRCQKENGGEWVGSIPVKYMDWIAEGKHVWAPHYTLHKTLMGLFDMYALGGNAQALDILQKWASWFDRWSARFTRAQFDEILDFETGGMLEIWANLYGETKDEKYLKLMKRYERKRLFDRLLAGEDALTNMHANTTIPEAIGAAKAWEVTGVRRWRDIAEAYWRCAVTDRGFYCTGGQTSGEIWGPPSDLSARLSEMNQEHCTVYNMMRLAWFLLRWTGKAEYADYIERNLYNGILAQQNPITGMVAYFLPLAAGSVKKWGTPTDDFWCCHGSLVQAHALHEYYLYCRDAEGPVINQYFPSRFEWRASNGAHAVIEQVMDTRSWNVNKVVSLNPGAIRRPDGVAVDIRISCSTPEEFTVKFRIPWWVSGAPSMTIDGVKADLLAEPSRYYGLKRKWKDNTVRLEFPKSLTSCMLPGAAAPMMAFMDGPVVLAGICNVEKTLRAGNPKRPEDILVPFDERRWGIWTPDYYTTGQDENIRFIPLHNVVDERYTVYFPVRKRN